MKQKKIGNKKNSYLGRLISATVFEQLLESKHNKTNKMPDIEN